MKKNYLLILLPAILFFTSCKTPSYYLSPLNSNSNYYHTIPLKSDSVKAATYASGAFLAGRSNFAWRDAVTAFQGDIHRSNNFGNFQAFYGANITLGKYSVQQNNIVRYRYDSSAPYDNHYDTLAIPSSGKFFGAYGCSGGINYVGQFKNGGECRIGIEASLNKEFGNYLSFRKALPDSLIDILEKNNWIKTLGVYFDFVFITKRDIRIGYKIALGSSVVSAATYLGRQNNITPIYFSQTFHVTHKQFTWFGQSNFVTYAASLQFGGNYNLEVKKQKL